MEIVSETKCFGGVQGVYRHASKSCCCDMTFGLFLPEVCKGSATPVVWYLSGLTCTHENAMTKSMAQYYANLHRVAVVFPDTSPRGSSVPDDESYDLGTGAGFYVDATEEPWNKNYRMREYIETELPEFVFSNFPLSPDMQGICGHSMGGHGALTIAMANPKRFCSVSAFAPIANPTKSDWGRKQFRAYLGENESNWQEFDSTILMKEKGFPGPVLVDQGTEDPFYDLLKPESLLQAMVETRQNCSFHMRDGFDHSYFFVMSFIADHIEFHRRAAVNS
ncbi:MAG: S-formylglutathione hydrolase [Albidovulum sp.]|nr:S-formylglutathione hydrolase [Albidovulum sp.]